MTRTLLRPARDAVDLLIFVRDIAMSLDFYQRLLGLEPAGAVETPFGTSHRLRYGKSLVKLMDPKQMPPAGPRGADQQLGYRCVSFPTRELTGVCATLVEEGVEFVMPPTQVFPGTRVALIKDPDGNFIELIERA